ncbi:hypothetical protein I5M27_08105 [Adhaeribacter sp. BT258]|uniref:Uncharacterized protein n=1 Tax=Adhaeribacter terrigena TaxID=2793070 RepID=A0ABS1C0N8_9BACT|nr:hypothetical protein [Adhaeribacter terrigena]MBK0402947.1 hypothetical protein [Adhaeribacter terrigena]
MSAEILKVILKETLPDQVLHLQVTDENGFLLYAKPLIPKPAEPDTVTFNEYPEVPVNKRFIFSAQLEVRIEAQAGNTFEVEVQYV